VGGDLLGQIRRRWLVTLRGFLEGDEQMRDISRTFARSIPKTLRCDQQASRLFWCDMSFWEDFKRLVPCTTGGKVKKSHVKSDMQDYSKLLQ
jgi:hypothetical protein